MKSYKVFKISSEPFLPDLLSGLLWELDIEGITENDNQLSAFANEESNVNEEVVKELLNNLITQNIIKNFSVKSENLEEKNWNELWEKSREVIRVSEKIVIKPTFREYKSTEDEIVIKLDPKMSFGTGEHESTQLVLQLLEKYISDEEKVLDVGSGTGILTIVAVKLGASSAVAVDNDEWCYENCRENCELNDVSNNIKIIHGTIDDIEDNEFDLVLANIQKNILLSISAKIKEKLKKNGIIILSGLLLKDETETINHYQSIGFIFKEKKVMDAWVALVLMAHGLNRLNG